MRKLLPLAILAAVTLAAFGVAMEIATWRAFRAHCLSAGHSLAACDAAYRGALDAPVLVPRLPDGGRP